MKNIKTTKKNQENTVNLQVSVATLPTRSKKNGEVKKLPDKNSRNFTTRMVPRYDKIPPPPGNLPQPQFSEASEKVLLERYVKKNGNREHVETIAERFWAVAYDVASADIDFGASKKQVQEKAVEFYKLLVSQRFEPNSPTLMNAGKGNGLQYSACFVLPIGDSMEEIFSTIKDTALIHQSGGGTGFSFSRLRPKGSPVKTTGGVASGPVSFLRVLNASTESVKQGGTRRGANMGILRIDHPDILEFIRCKSELDEYNRPVYETISPSVPEDLRPYFKQLLLDRQISNFNISVAVTDKFMDAYFKGERYDLINPQNGEVVGSLNAREVFDEIVERAWRNGDPGVVFIDRINNSPANPLPLLDTIESTNPCGEQPLAPYDSCNLGSINLGKYVLEDGSGVDWDSLKETTWLAVSFLDNVVQVSPFGLEQVYNKVHENRRIGLGVMGWADMLFSLKVPYDSDEALQLAEKIMNFINTEARMASQLLAKERGAFPMFPFSVYKDDKPVRNAAITTIAPTGTISIIADCSSGIEPVFALAFKHMAHGADNQPRKLIIANKVFENIAKKEGFYCQELMEKVMENGTVADLEEVPGIWKRVFVTAQEIDPIWHVKMQAVFQKYTDNGVSKTVNLRGEATKEDVEKVYLLAWETGCKGITIYRDGSKSAQILNIASSLKKNINSEEVRDVETSHIVVAARPMILRGRTYKVNTPVGKAFITINRTNEDEPFETFITIGRAGMHTAADAEAIGRMISLVLRIADGNRLEIAQEIVMQLGGIGGSSHIGFGKDRVMSLADAIAKVLAEELSQLKSTQSFEPQTESLPLDLTLSPAENNSGDLSLSLEEEATVPKVMKTKVADLCPECGQATFTFEEGCKKCHSCGYSMC